MVLDTEVVSVAGATVVVTRDDSFLDGLVWTPSTGTNAVDAACSSSIASRIETVRDCTVDDDGDEISDVDSDCD